MAKHSFVLALIAATAGTTQAQDVAQTVTVTGRAPATAAVAGFDDTPLSRAPFSATVIGPPALQRRRHRQPGRHHARRRRASPTPTTRWATGATSPCAATRSTTATTTGATACRSTPRRRCGSATSRASMCCAAPAACRPASARRAAWSTSWSSGPTARTAARCSASSPTARSGWPLDLGNRAGADGSIGWRLSAEATHLDPPLNARARRSPGHRGGGRLAHRCRQAARGRDRIQPPVAAQPARLQHARALGCPTRATSTRASTSTTSHGACRWCSPGRPRRCAGHNASAAISTSSRTR